MMSARIFSIIAWFFWLCTLTWAETTVASGSSDFILSSVDLGTMIFVFLASGLGFDFGEGEPFPPTLVTALSSILKMFFSISSAAFFSACLFLYLLNLSHIFAALIFLTCFTN